MLQHNTVAAGRRAHITHAAVLAMHAICCGLPALALIALSAGASGVALLSDSIAEFHAFLHGHEFWILGFSALLVVSGGWLEALSRRGGHAHGTPWLFYFSALCFVANAAIIFVHRV